MATPDPTLLKFLQDIAERDLTKDINVLEWSLDIVMHLRIKYDIVLRGENFAAALGILPVLGVVRAKKENFTYFKKFDVLSGAEYRNAAKITDYRTQAARLAQFQRVELLDYGNNWVRDYLENNRSDLELVRWAIPEDFDTKHPHCPAEI